MHNHAVLLPCACERCAPRLAGCAVVAAEARALAASAAPEDLSRVARFLAACSGDSLKASHVLTDSLLWRHEFGADTLGDTNGPVGTDATGPAVVASATDTAARWAAVQRFFPMGLLEAHGAHGHPVAVVRLGLCDPTFHSLRVHGDETGEEAWLRAHVSLNEQASTRSRSLILSSSLSLTLTLTLIARLPQRVGGAAFPNPNPNPNPDPNPNPNPNPNPSPTPNQELELTLDAFNERIEDQMSHLRGQMAGRVGELQRKI